VEPRKISLSESAYADLANIEAYIAQDSPSVARNFVNRIFEKMEQLYVHPESGRIVPEFNNKKIRELLLKKYRIVYQIVSEEEITILRVVHGSRLLDLDIE
jgi:addiction module RelE/StbE family toxin